MSNAEKAILIADYCDSCKQLLEKLKQNGTLSNYRVINVATPEGNEIAQKLGITAIPDCVVIAKDKDGADVARRCTEAEEKEVLSSGESSGT